MLTAIWQSAPGIQFALLLAAFLLALWRGAGPEQAAAMVMLALLGVDRLFHLVLWQVQGQAATAFGHFSIDLAALAAFTLLALRANRLYPMGLAALQLIAVTAHLVRAISPAIPGRANAIMMVAPSYLELLVLIGGILLHMRRESRTGPYRSWRMPKAAR
jgi:hypothetical protein